MLKKEDFISHFDKLMNIQAQSAMFVKFTIIAL